MRTGLGDSILESLEKAIYLATSNDITSAASASSSEWGSERIASLGLAISSTLKGYTTTAAKITAALLSSAVKFTVQVSLPWTPDSRRQACLNKLHLIMPK